MTLLSRFDRWFTSPLPAARLATFRLLVGCYAAIWSAIRLPEHLALVRQPDERWEPVGVLAPFADPPSDAAISALAVALPLLATVFALGWRYRVTGPMTAGVLLVVLTFASSWGQVFHTENLLALHVLVLALAPAAATASWDARRAGSPPVADSGRYGWPLKLAGLVTVATYVLAGWAKLRTTGLDWADGELLRGLVAHDNLRKELLGDTSSPIGAAVAGQVWLFPPLAVAALTAELVAPLAFAHRRVRDAWVALAWLFHVGVLALMAVLFPYHLVGLAFAPFFRLERLPSWLSASLRLRRSRRPLGTDPEHPSPRWRTCG